MISSVPQAQPKSAHRESRHRHPEEYGSECLLRTADITDRLILKEN